MSYIDRYKQAKDRIRDTANKLEKIFNSRFLKHIAKIASKIKEKEHFFVLGKGQNYHNALEGALKVKEISYKHFEGFAGGELKHGVIALIEKGTPIFIIISDDIFKNDMLSAAAEVKARGAYLIAIAKEENDLFDELIKLPDAGLCDSIINVVPFQLLSYYLALALGRSPDKPRNLAKSVTVK